MFGALRSKVVTILSICAVLGAVLVSIPAYSATLPAPKISAAPKAVKFANTKAGGTSSTATVTVLNTGTQDLVISSMTITGTNAAEFSQMTDIAGPIAPAGSGTVSVTFSPVEPFGKKSAVLNIASNDPKKPVLAVKLMGTSPGPVISASPMSVNLGTLETGARSLPTTVTIRNTGVSDLNISSISITGTDAADFAQTNDCPDALATGETCSVDVTFLAATEGKKGAVLEVASNSPKKPLLAIKLMGTGVNPGSVNSPFVGADIVGVWENHILHSGGWDGWMRGPVTVAGDNSFTFDETDSSGGSGTDSGTLSISSTGVVSISCSTCNSGLQYFMDLGKTFAARANSDSNDGPELSAMAKKADSYSQDDLTGSWHLQSIKLGPTPMWNRGAFTVAADGSFTISETKSDGSSNSNSSTMSVSADGALSIAGGGDPTMQINVDAGKTIMVGTETNDAQTGEYELSVVLKQGPSYSTPDLEGTWNFEELMVDPVNGAVSGSGSVKVSATGAVTGSVTRTDGQTESLNGTVSLSSTGQFSVVGDTGSGYMDAGKTVIVLTDLHDGGAVSMTILTKRSN